jgi:hypothetical protein
MRSGEKKGEMIMKKMLIIMAVVIVALFGLSLTASAESPQEEVSADFTYSPTCLPGNMKLAGGNMFLDCTDVGVWAGDFTGTSYEEYVAVLHGFEGFFIYEKGFYKGIATFTGDVNGKEGTLKILFIGTSTGSPNMDDWTGTWRILNGTGELENLHGTGIFYNNAPLDIHFEGKIHYAP